MADKRRKSTSDEVVKKRKRKSVDDKTTKKSGSRKVSKTTKAAKSGKSTKTSKAKKSAKKSRDYDDIIMVSDDNVAKSKVRRYGARKQAKQNKQKDNTVSRKIGIVLASLQIVASVVFLLALFMLGMLPNKYLIAIAVVLAILGVVALIGQMKSKKKAIGGKVFSFFMALVLFVGSFYIFKTNSAVSEISGGNSKLDNIIVAVPIDDPAETIEDAADYNFGVQYTLKGEQIEETVEAINEELGSEIETTEYRSVQEQATMLHDGEVDAIILNEAYAGIIEEEFGDFSNSVKIIYTHAITTALENATNDIKVEDESFTVYISGIDVYGAIETNSRSDVNILAVVNPNSHQILLVTTPRDYFVELPGISGGQKDKLTHAGIYGVDVSMDTLDALYDTESEFYARVNFTSLIQMVDALGGIDVYSEYAFTTSADSGLVMEVAQGYNHFNGKQALAFSRERQNLPDGDFQRGKNQQAVITAMIKKAISPAILTGANGLLEAVSGNVDTNMSQDQIQSLIKSQLNDPQAWMIKSMAAEGTGDTQICFSIPGTPVYVTQPDQASVDAIIAAIDAVENGETLEGSETAE